MPSCHDIILERSGENGFYSKLDKSQCAPTIIQASKPSFWMFGNNYLCDPRNSCSCHFIEDLLPNWTQVRYM